MLVGTLLNFGGSQAICFPLLLDFLTTAIAMVSVPGLFVSHRCCDAIHIPANGLTLLH